MNWSLASKHHSQPMRGTHPDCFELHLEIFIWRRAEKHMSHICHVPQKPKGQKRAGGHSPTRHHSGLPRMMRERSWAGWTGTFVPGWPSSVNFFCPCWLSCFWSLLSRSPRSAHISCGHPKQLPPEGHAWTETLTGWFPPQHGCTPPASAGSQHVHREWLAFCILACRAYVCCDWPPFKMTE